MDSKTALESELTKLNQVTQNENKSDYEKPSENTGLRDWIKKNLMLLGTLVGVILGVIEGQFSLLFPYK